MNEDGYPTREDFQCDWEDHYTDMHPEFAPDPLVVRCDATASVIFAGFDGQFGHPVTRKLCAAHAAMFEEDDSPEQYPTRWTRVDREPTGA